MAEKSSQMKKCFIMLMIEEVVSKIVITSTRLIFSSDFEALLVYFDN